MKAFLLGLLLSYPSVAFAEDPKFTEVKEGQPAPFDGRLLNDAAISKLIIENRFKVDQCDIQIDYEVSKAKTKDQYKYDLLLARSEADDMRLNDMIVIRDDHIKELQKHIKPSNKHWWLGGGFVIGAGSAIAIMYAVTPGLR